MPCVYNGRGAFSLSLQVINPRHMHEGYGSHSVCVCVSVTKLTATYLVNHIARKFGGLADQPASHQTGMHRLYCVMACYQYCDYSRSGLYNPANSNSCWFSLQKLLTLAAKCRQLCDFVHPSVWTFPVLTGKSHLRDTFYIIYIYIYILAKTSIKEWLSCCSCAM